MEHLLQLLGAGLAWVLGFVTLENYLRVVLYLTPATFALYILIMHFKRVQDRLPRDLVTLGQVLLALGMLHNFAFNVLVASVLFFDIPRQFTTTGRLNRHWRDGHPGWRGWRERVALFIRHRLDPFDPRGIHS